MKFCIAVDSQVQFTGHDPGFIVNIYGGHAEGCYRYLSNCIRGYLLDINDLYVRSFSIALSLNINSIGG